MPACSSVKKSLADFIFLDHFNKPCCEPSSAAYLHTTKITCRQIPSDTMILVLPSKFCKHLCTELDTHRNTEEEIQIYLVI